VAVIIGPSHVDHRDLNTICPNSRRSVRQRSRPTQPLRRQLQPPPAGASGPRPSSRCGSDHCLQGRSRMPVLLRELPRANDMGTLHTHAMTPIDESNLYRKWCVPAALINALASVTLMSDDDVDELAGERWVERPCFARPLEGARDYPPPHRAQEDIRNRLGHKDSRERWVPGSHEVLGRSTGLQPGQFAAVTHQRWPGTSPGNQYSDCGGIRAIDDHDSGSRFFRPDSCQMGGRRWENEERRTSARHPAPKMRRPTRRNGRASSITSGTPRCVGEYGSSPGSRLPRGVRPVAARSPDSAAS
jgi:hypothetical protein